MKNLGLLIFIALQLCSLHTSAFSRDTTEYIKPVISTQKEYSFGLIQDIKDRIYLEKYAKSFTEYLKREAVIVDSVKIVQNLYSRTISNYNAHEIAFFYHTKAEPDNFKIGVLYFNNLEGIQSRVSLVENKYYLLEKGSFIDVGSFNNSKGVWPIETLNVIARQHIHLSLDSSAVNKAERQAFLKDYLLTLNEVKRGIVANHEYLTSNNYTNKEVYYLPDTLGSGRVRLTNNIITLIYNSDSSKIKNDFDDSLVGLDSIINTVEQEIAATARTGSLQYATTSSTELFELISKHKDSDIYDILYYKNNADRSFKNHVSYTIVGDSHEVLDDYKVFYKAVYMNYQGLLTRKKFLGLF